MKWIEAWKTEWNRLSQTPSHLQRKADAKESWNTLKYLSGDIKKGLAELVQLLKDRRRR